MSTASLQTLFTTPESEDRLLEIPGFPDWGVKRYSRPRDFAAWPAAGTVTDDFWLSPATLSFLSTQPQGVVTGGVELVERGSGRRVLFTVQSFRFQLRDNVADAAGAVVSRWNLRRRLLSACTAEVLCFGQLLASGDHGLAAEGVMSGSERTELILALAEVLGGGYRAVLLKDLITAGSSSDERLQQRGFHRLPADPVMELDLRPFAGLADYLGRLSSKYRVRYRRARSKLAGLERRPLSATDVAHFADRLHALYRETSRGADFNVVTLTPGYFRWLGEAGVVHGYFNEQDDLVGFTTAIPNGDRYHAHYLGLQEGYKHSHHLYHNMLYDLLDDALAGRYAVLDYGRTALEIKSSLGAEPRRCNTYLRLRPSLLNTLVPRFVPAVFEPKPWQPRNPFKG